MQRYFLKTRRHFIAPYSRVGGNTYFGVRLFCAAAVLGASSCGMLQNKIEASRSGGSVDVDVQKLYPIEAKPFDVVNVKGSGFYSSRNLKARLSLDGGSANDVHLTIVDMNTATFVMPDGAGLGLKSVSIVQGESKELASFRLVANSADNQLPILIDDQSEICSTKVYIDRNGDQKTGTKDCASGAVPECSSNGQQSCVVTGAYFAGATCADDGSNCFLPSYSVMSQPLKAISYISIDQSKMLDSLTVSGVSGTIPSKGSWDLSLTFPGAGFYTGITNSPGAGSFASGMTIAGIPGSGAMRPADCSTDGATGCVAVAGYPAALASGAASKILSGQTLAGVSGNVTLPAVGKVYTGTNYGVSGSGNTGTLTLPLAVNVLSGSGTYGNPGEAVTPALANQGSWNLTTSFPGVGYYTGVSNSPTAANIATGTTITGVAGTATLSPVNCSANGQQSCVAAGTYFAGTACALDGSNCFLPTYSVPGLQTKKAIDYATLDSSRMLDSLTVSGITGALASKGSWNLTLAFPGEGYYTGTSNTPTAATIASGTTITGVSGLGTIESHSNCTADGVTGCVTTTNYKSADMTAAITGNIKSGSTIAGVAGSVTSESHSNCAVDGATGCVAVAGYPAALASGAASKIVSGQTLAGVSGNVTLPAVGKVYTGTNYGVSGSGNTGTLTLPLAVNVLSGSGTYGNPGEAVTPALANQGSWNLTTSFPGVGYYTGVSNSPTAANIATGTTITGVAGTATLSPVNCSANGQQSCVAAGTYFAGTACALDGSNCFLPTYSVPGLQTKKAIDFSTIDSSKMLSTLTVSGVIGSIAAQAWNLQNSFPGSGYYSSVTNTPATSTYTGTLFGSGGTATLESHSNCSADGATGCVTTSSYKSANMTNAVATNIKSGVTIAGILGSYTGGGGGTVCGLGGNASGNCTLSQYNASTYPLYATFSGGGDPVVYGTTLNLWNGSSTVTYNDVINYTFKANETRWFKIPFTGCSSIEDNLNFSATSTFTAKVYDRDLIYNTGTMWTPSAKGSYPYQSASGVYYADLTRPYLNGSTCDSVSYGGSGTSYQYVLITNGGSAQTIRVNLESVGY